MTPPEGGSGSGSQRRLAIGLGVGGLLLFALAGGVWVRALTWEYTAPIRFRGDLASAFRWGLLANRTGYLRLYDEVASAGLARRPVDYPPLRLLVMSLWARWVASHHGRAYATSAAVMPLRMLNLVCEILTAAGLGLLVCRWSASGVDPPRARRRRFLPGVGAALVFWFNPAVILDAHGFPQWDVWALPFFVGAVLLSCAGWWFTSGAVIALGATLKGQLLLVAPLFVLWPLFARRWEAIPRWVIGFCAGAAAIVSPWLLRDPAAAGWLILAVAILVALDSWGRGPALTPRWWETVCTAAILPAWAWFLSARPLAAGLAAMFGLVLIAAARILPRRHWLLAVPAALVVAALVGAWLFNGSFGWLSVGFGHGVMRFPVLARSHVANIPAILGSAFGWTAKDAVLWLPGMATVGIKAVLAVGYALTLALCARAAARNERGRDARFLIAVTAPWALFFTLLPQMLSRYLVWGAGLTAVAVAVGPAPTLAHAVLTLVATAMIAATMFRVSPLPMPAVLRWLTDPAAGLAVASAAALLLYVALFGARSAVKG